MIENIEFKSHMHVTIILTRPLARAAAVASVVCRRVLGELSPPLPAVHTSTLITIIIYTPFECIAFEH